MALIVVNDRMPYPFLKKRPITESLYSCSISVYILMLDFAKFLCFPFVQNKLPAYSQRAMSIQRREDLRLCTSGGDAKESEPAEILARDRT